MEMLHTLEEIKHWDKIQELIMVLEGVYLSFKQPEIKELIDKYQSSLDEELSKYQSYIGRECTAPPPNYYKSKERLHGKIEGDFFFNVYSKSVRCKFRYSDGGVDSKAIRELQ